MSNETKMNLKNFVSNIMEENAYTPDLPELYQKEWHYLFTYGSLKRGFCRSNILKYAELVGSGFTMDDEYVMYRTLNRSNGFPIIFPHTGEQRGVIHGELYRVPTELFTYLDMMESNGTLYHRTEIPLNVRVYGQKDVWEQCNAWCYVGDAKNWTKYMNNTKIQVCDRQGPRAQSKEHYYIYMRKYEQEQQQQRDAA